jgi:hypothetical protein
MVRLSRLADLPETEQMRRSRRSEGAEPAAEGRALCSKHRLKVGAGGGVDFGVDGRQGVDLGAAGVHVGADGGGGRRIVVPIGTQRDVVRFQQVLRMHAAGCERRRASPSMQTRGIEGRGQRGVPGQGRRHKGTSC